MVMVTRVDRGDDDQPRAGDALSFVHEQLS